MHHITSHAILIPRIASAGIHIHIYINMHAHLCSHDHHHIDLQRMCTCSPSSHDSLQTMWRSYQLHSVDHHVRIEAMYDVSMIHDMINILRHIPHRRSHRLSRHDMNDMIRRHIATSIIGSCASISCHTHSSYGAVTRRHVSMNTPSRACILTNIVHFLFPV